MARAKEPHRRQRPDSKTGDSGPEASGPIAIMTSELGHIERMADEFVRTTAGFGWEEGPLGRASAIGQVIHSVLSADPKIPVGIAELLASCALKIHSTQNVKPEPRTPEALNWTPRPGLSEGKVQELKEALGHWREEARRSLELAEEGFRENGAIDTIGIAYGWATMAVSQGQLAGEFVALLFELHDAHAENARLRGQVEQLTPGAAEGIAHNFEKLLGGQDGPTAPAQ